MITCPTRCDADCEATCHEEHQVFFKREHSPEDCPGNQTDFARLHEALRAICAEHWVGDREDGSKVIVLHDLGYGEPNAADFDCTTMTRFPYRVTDEGYSGFYHQFDFDAQGALVSQGSWE